MSSIKKMFVGLGLVGGAFLATWLFAGTGHRAQKTRKYIGRRVLDLRDAAKRDRTKVEDNDTHYV